MSFGPLPSRSCRGPMTVLPLHRIHNRHCWHRSTGFTALPAVSNQQEVISPTSASSLIETGAPKRDEDRTMTNIKPLGRHRMLGQLSAIASLSVALGACNFTGTEVLTASVPDDYRHRHPIAIQEA